MSQIEDDLRRLLDEEKKLSEFRRERWENAEARLEAVWNQAIGAAREKLGQHTPACDANEAMPCWLCWQNAKLTSLLRLERSGYVTVRERIERLRLDLVSSLDSCDHLIKDGINEMAERTSDLFGEKE
jgi:hypothetical protein